MGAVYLAVDESLQQQVALKTLLPALASDVRAIEKMKREVRTARDFATRVSARHSTFGTMTGRRSL